MNIIVDKNEAPEGFFAVSKDDINQNKGNLCRQCDARKLCQENLNEWCHLNRCMADPVIYEKDNKTYQRNDGASVVFKKIF